MNHLADDAILSNSSFLETAYEVTSPAEALFNSLMIQLVNVLLDLWVPCCAPLARFLSATSSLLDGDESTALGCDTAPNLILVISSSTGAVSSTISASDN